VVTGSFPALSADAEAPREVELPFAWYMVFYLIPQVSPRAPMVIPRGVEHSHFCYAGVLKGPQVYLSRITEL